MQNIIFYVGMAILATATLLLIGYNDQGTIFGMDLSMVAGIASGLALLVLIGPGAFFAQGLSKTVKMIAIWLLIFFGLATVYKYQVPLKEMGQNIMASFGLGEPVGSYHGDKRPIISYQGGDGSYYLDGRVNGSPLTFLVDTGADATVIRAEDAEDIGFDINSLIYNHPFQTANGKTFAAQVKVKTFDIADVDMGNRWIFISRPGDLGQNLLGMDFLNRLSAFSFKGNQLILEP